MMSRIIFTINGTKAIKLESSYIIFKLVNYTQNMMSSLQAYVKVYFKPP